MAPTVVDRVWRSTTPDAVEPELAALWREVAQHGPVARAVMSNLVVFRRAVVSGPPGERTIDLDQVASQLPLDDVAARHPSRLILIEHDRQPQTSSAPFAASVAIVTFGPPRTRYAVEEIAVRSSCGEASLPSIVRRLLRGDLPTSVWWFDDLSEAPPIDAIVAVGRQLVYDSRRWRDVRRGVLALAHLVQPDPSNPTHPIRVDLADVNWRRLTPLRQALIHACRTSQIDGLQRAEVAILHGPGEAALAWLAVGWLSGRLGWARSASPRIEESRQSDDEVLSIAVGGESVELTATLNAHRVLVKHASHAAPFTVSVPQEGEADAVAAELRNLSHDACLHDALRALVARFA